MQIGLITVSGRPIGVIALSVDGDEDKDSPSFATENEPPIGDHAGMGAGAHHGGRHGPRHHGDGTSGGHYTHHEEPRIDSDGLPAPAGNKDDPVRDSSARKVPSESNRVYGRFADARDRARQELKDKPWLNEKAMHIFAGENDDPDAATALWESAINRAAVRGTSLEQELRRTNEGGYYAGWRDGVSNDTRAALEYARERALAGSNISNYATDNASSWLAEGHNRDGSFTEKQVYNREHFFGPDNRVPAHQSAYSNLVNESEAARGATSDAISGDTPRGSANHMRGQYGAAGDNLVRIETPSGKTAQVHKDAAPSFQGFLSDLEKSGYKVNDLGGYNHRNIRGGSGLSQHAYGNAIDINPAQNPQYGGTNMPPNVSDMAAKWGLSWGGDWSSRYRDPMHFEWTGRRPWQDKPAVTQAKPTEQHVAPIANATKPEVPWMPGLRRTKEDLAEHYRPDPASEPPVP